MNPALIYCMSDDACHTSPITAHDWVVSGLALLGVAAVMALVFWLAERLNVRR